MSGCRGDLERAVKFAYDLGEDTAILTKARPLMSIDSLLKKLVTQVKGATGAIVLGTDGEAVQWYAPAGGERLRLRGAYVAVELKACLAAASRAKIGSPRGLLLEYDHSSLIVREIDDDCLVVVELGPSANIGQALFLLDPIIAELRQEIAA